MQSLWENGIYVSRDSVCAMGIEELIERGRQGDETALGSLYRAYHRQMAAICQRIIGHRQVAEELAHDAFLLAFAKMDQLRDPKRFEAWLTSITTNVARRYVQRHHEPTMLSLSTLSEEAIGSAASLVEELPGELIPTEDQPLPTMAELMATVDALPHGYGQVFKLAVIQEMSHKEIAEILGIAAHSSSSQLSRAKKLLQRSLAKYWLLWLLPLALPVTLYLYKTGRTAEEPQPIVSKQEHTKPIATQRIVTVPTEDVSVDIIVPADTLHHTSEETERTDTTAIPHDNKPLPDLHPDNDTHIADLRPEQSTEVKGRQTKWSLDLAYTGGMGDRLDSRPSVIAGMVVNDKDISSEKPTPLISTTFNSWSDYANYLLNNPGEEDRHKHNVLLEIARNNARQPGDDKIQRKSHHYMPITFSLALKYQLSNRFGLETGLSYSRQRSEFEMGSDGNAIHEQQTIHYLGIPLKGSYHIYHIGRWDLYGSLGAKVDIPVYAPLSTSYFVNGMKALEEKSMLHAPLQWSVGTSLGLQYNLTPNLGFFTEPSLQYYIPTGSDIETYRTEHPLMFSLPLGIRITW